MGLFSSSWKYQAFAASTPLLEDESEHPHTFQKVMLEGLSADDTFGNILRYTLITDMYARSKSMVRYATRENDPYVRGLPTSGLTTFNIQKEWINSAILREIKMPLIDFFWMKHGIFDAHYVGCKFIHDHYMDIDYFPWPDGCLPDIKNPNFDDALEHWIPTDFQHNADQRVAELTADGGTLFSDQVGNVTPGEIISLRAVCCRGSDDPAQTGHINITFYNSSGGEITTMSASNNTGGPDEWQLLTVIATVPAGAVTAKAWAGGTMGGSQVYLTEELIPDYSAYIQGGIINFYPWSSWWGEEPPAGQKELGYVFAWINGKGVFSWRHYYRFTEVEWIEDGEWFVKYEVTYSSPYVSDDLVLDWGGGALNVWHDLNDEGGLDQYHLQHQGIVQEYKVNVHLAPGLAGSPNLSQTTVFPFTFRSYRGRQETVYEDDFSVETGGLDWRDPATAFTTDRRHFDGPGSHWSGWRDVFYDAYETWDYGWISVSSAGYAYSSGPGDLYDESLYAINMPSSNIFFGCAVTFEKTLNTVWVPGGIVVRLKDQDNFWLIAVKNPESTEPILGIYKVVGGVHTLVEGIVVSQYNQHGFDNTLDSMELVVKTHGSKIIVEGYPKYPDQFQFLTLEVDDPTFSSETEIGFWAAAAGVRWDEVVTHLYPLGGNIGEITDREWDIWEWDDSPISGSNTSCGDTYAHFYIYDNSNGKLQRPFHASYAFTNSVVGSFGSWLNWRLVPISNHQFLVQFQAVSGNTDSIILAEYGSFANAASWGEWVDADLFIVYLEALEGTSKTATIKGRFALAQPGGSYKNRAIISGTESVWKNITLTATSTGPC